MAIASRITILGNEEAVASGKVTNFNLNRELFILNDRLLKEDTEKSFRTTAKIRTFVFNNFN